MSYDLEAMRKKVRTQMSGKRSDPDEFRPPKAESGKELKFRFFILPPYNQNDVLRTGPAEHGMDTFFVPYGIHFGVCTPPQPCPRVCSGESCPICQHGFDLMKEAGNDKELKKAISQEWMAANYHVVNIYFPPGNNNPSDYEGRVMYYKAPKTCVDKWIDALERSGPGDALDPQAYGAFFDETAGFMYQLSCKVKGQNNTYESSMFLANAGNPMPISSDPAVVQQILASRFDLFSKLEMPNPTALQIVAQNLINGVNEDDGFTSSVESSKTTQTSSTSSKTTQTSAASNTQSAASNTQSAASNTQSAASNTQSADSDTAAKAAAAKAAAAKVAAAKAKAAAAEAAAALAEAEAELETPNTVASVVTETVKPPSDGGGGDTVMSEIESMLESFDS